MRTVLAAVAANVAELRKLRGHTVRSLSVVLGVLGRPILPSGITKIEAGQRRVDVDDLVALAMALHVNPNRLLLPVDAPNSTVALTPKVQVSSTHAWTWASGDNPLFEAETVMGHGDESGMRAAADFLRDVWPPHEGYAYTPRFRAVLDQFLHDVWPPEERRRRQHTSVRAARDVLSRIERVLVVDDMGGKWEERYEDDPRPALRRALNRLVAEVEDLLGDDDGQR